MEADAVHEQIVRHEVVAGLLADEPRLEADVAFGCAATVLLEDRLAAHLPRPGSRGAVRCEPPCRRLESGRTGACLAGEGPGSRVNTYGSGPTPTGGAVSHV